MSSNAKGQRATSAQPGAPAAGAAPTAADAADAADAPTVPEAPEEFPDVAQLSYEAARDELVAVVATLEAGDAGLEESMRLWRRGEALAAHCSTWLDDAESSLRGAESPDGTSTED